MFSNYDFPTGTFRDLATGVDPAWADPENADGATDDAGIPGAEIDTRLDGPYGLPWWDGFEDPFAKTGLFQSQDLSMADPAVGASPIVGAYEGAFRTRGPVVAFGYEDQAVGRIMRFPAIIPERYDADGVFDTDYRDTLAQALINNSMPYVTDAEVTTGLMTWPNVGQY
jgi:hypothetical protein